MGQRCAVCSHSKRLKIDRSIVKGRSYTKIGLKYEIPMMSVRNHAKNHLSRQMLKSGEMKEVTHSKNLFVEVQELIQKTKDVLENAEDDNQPTISLGAIRELRQTYEFLIKFSVYMEEAKKKDREAEKKNMKFTVDIIKERLSGEELSLLNKLMSKMDGDISKDTDILKDAGISTYDRYKSRYQRYDIDDDDAEDDLTETKVEDVSDDITVKKKKKSNKKKSSKMKRKKKPRIEDREDEVSGGMFVGETSVGVTGDGRSIRDL